MEAILSRPQCVKVRSHQTDAEHIETTKKQNILHVQLHFREIRPAQFNQNCTYLVSMVSTGKRQFRIS